MKKIAIVLIYIVLLPILIQAQPEKKDFPVDKKGTFRIRARTDYARGLNFSQSEMAANLEQIKKLVAIVQQNPVLAEMMGFNAQARLDDISGVIRCSYGVPVNVEFEIWPLTRNKAGEIVSVTDPIEPPEWELQVNCMNGIGINSDYHDMNKCYFTVPFNKKTIAPGIDLYDGEDYVIYDPSRPPYWIPVTVNDAFASAREFAAKEKDEFTARLNKQMLDQEWAEIPVASRDKPAFFGGNLSRVSPTSGFEGQENLFPPIVTVNPEYWNKNRPKSDIQFLVFKIRDKKTLNRLVDEDLKQKSNGYHCALFEQAMDEEFVKSLLPLVIR